MRKRSSLLRIAEAATGSASAYAPAALQARAAWSRSAWASHCGSWAGVHPVLACALMARSSSRSVRRACSSRAAFLASLSAFLCAATWAAAMASEISCAARWEE